MEAANCLVNERAPTSSTLFAVTETTRIWLDVADATAEALRACAEVRQINEDARWMHALADELYADDADVAEVAEVAEAAQDKKAARG